MALSYKCLSGMGAAIHDKDYASMILMSLLNSYTSHLEILTDVAIGSGRTFTAHDIITKVTELTDKQQVWAGHHSKLNPKNSAFQTVEPHTSVNILCYKCNIICVKVA